MLCFVSTASLRNHFVCAFAGLVAFGVTQAFAATITVTSVGDGLGAGSGCTLRAAITAVNTSAAVGDCPAGGAMSGDTIAFNIPGAGVKTIVPMSPLPTIVSNVIIDGYTQPGAAANTLPVGQGSNATLLIEIDGANVGDAPLLKIANPIGETAASASVIRGLSLTSSNNAAGGSLRFGIYLENLKYIWIEGNFIGVAPDGVTAKGLKSGGIWIDGPVVQISVGAMFDEAAPNPATMNVISGNGGNGITVRGSDGLLSIYGNLVGTDRTGLVALPNGGSGLFLQDVKQGFGGIIGNRIAHNVISGNLGGLSLSNSEATLIDFNKIGVGVNGTSPLPNTGAAAGVFIGDNGNVPGSSVTDVRVVKNIIANNPGGGIAVVRSAAGNTVRKNWLSQNVTYNNGALNGGINNIDLSVGLPLDGVSPNDAGDTDTGPNDLLNKPIVTAASATSGNIAVAFSLNSLVGVNAYTFEFFHATTCATPAKGSANSYLGTVSRSTDATGNLSSSTTLFSGLTTGFIVATTTDNVNNTSEFSACVPIVNNAATRNLTANIPGGGGTVSFNPVGANCGQGCASYPNGTMVTATATALSGFVFSSWSLGSCGAAVTCTVTLNADTILTANFVAAPAPVAAALPVPSLNAINVLILVLLVALVGLASRGFNAMRF